MDVWKCFSSKDKVIDRRLKKDGWANLEVGIKNEIFTFGKVIQTRCQRAAAGLRTEATHSLLAATLTYPGLSAACPYLAFSVFLNSWVSERGMRYGAQTFDADLRA